ncbi:hypothetical protein JNW90_35135 [Micromonospora sp. STR1s_5]|nr:hypothetical protein [Micromonospora sp. STR1s_5]
MTMQICASTMPRANLPGLSLDAALQLDRIERHQSADRSILGQFLACLGSTTGPSSGPGAMFLQDNPLNVQIFSSALDRAEEAPSTNMAELERKLSAVLDGISDVAQGGNPDPNRVSALKGFCLSLHQALLNEASPFHMDDEPFMMRDEHFA